jgi:hypothetical protein
MRQLFSFAGMTLIVLGVLLVLLVQARIYFDF